MGNRSLTQEVLHVDEAFDGFRGEGSQGEGEGKLGGDSAFLQETYHLSPSLDDFGGRGEEEGPCAGDDGSAARELSALFEKELNPSGGHDAGKSPPWEGKEPLTGSGGDDQTVRLHLEESPRALESQGETPLEGEERRRRHHREGGERGKLFYEGETGPLCRGHPPGEG